MKKFLSLVLLLFTVSPAPVVGALQGVLDPVCDAGYVRINDSPSEANFRDVLDPKDLARKLRAVGALTEPSDIFRKFKVEVAGHTFDFFGGKERGK